MSLSEHSAEFPAVCDRLLSARAGGRAGHAYLLSGDDAGVLESFGLGWARVCACLNPLDSGDACGTCSPCTQLARGSYADLHELRPQSKSRRILVDDVRGMEHQLGLVSGRGRLKIGLLCDAECMGEEAQNAFLKTLEEPPAGTLLILTTTQPRRLLPTIRSRCQLISLLRNRRSYDLTIEAGVFPLLDRLRRGAGAAVGLSVATRLAAVFASLRSEADERTGHEAEDRWEAAMEDNPTLRKRLTAEREARVQAEYVRLRQEVLDGIQTWFLQLQLLAAGASPDALPQPELYEAAGGEDAGQRRPEWSAACADIAAAAELQRCLSSNVNERLALDAFCLAVTEKSAVA